MGPGCVGAVVVEGVGRLGVQPVKGGLGEAGRAGQPWESGSGERVPDGGERGTRLF